ncbi:hypothetical protein SGRIM128S_00096 [Streptomyces griseomycini]
MLGLVDAGHLVVLGDSHADGPVEEEGEDRGDDQGVGEDAEDTGALLPELVEAAAVEEARDVGLALAGGEEADEQRAEDAADEVDADDVEGVVVAEPVLQADGHGAQDTGDGAHRDRAERGDRAAGRGDGDQSGDRAGGGAQRGERAVADLLVGAPAQHGRAGDDLGVDELGAPTPSCAGLEPALKPNQPNHRSPAPSMTSGRLCGRIGSFLKPMRLPMTRITPRAAAPALMWTAVPPAKSMTPSSKAQPPAPQTQCATGK